MGNAAKELKKSEEGGQLSLMANMASELSGQPWYVQAAASKLMPIIQEAAIKEGEPKQTHNVGLGLRK